MRGGDLNYFPVPVRDNKRLVLLHSKEYLHRIHYYMYFDSQHNQPGTLTQSVVVHLGMQAVQRWIPASGTFFREDLVMKTFLRHSCSSADS